METHNVDKKIVKKVDGYLNTIQDFANDAKLTKGEFIDLVKLFITLYYE